MGRMLTDNEETQTDTAHNGNANDQMTIGGHEVGSYD